MPPDIPLPTFLGAQIPLLLLRACLCSTLACLPSILLLANYLSLVYAQKDSGTAALVNNMELL